MARTPRQLRSSVRPLLAFAGFGRLVSLGSHSSHVTTKPVVAFAAALRSFDGSRDFLSSPPVQKSKKPPRIDRPIKFLYGEEAYEHALGKAYRGLQASQQDKEAHRAKKARNGKRIQADMEYLAIWLKCRAADKKARDSLRWHDAPEISHIETMQRLLRAALAAKLRSLTPTVFAPLEDVGFMDRVGRILTTFARYFSGRFVLALGKVLLWSLRARKEYNDRAD